MSISYVTEETPAGDFEKITVSTTAIGITSTKLLINQTGGFHKRVVRAVVSVEDNPVRMRYDGTAPTSSVGHLLGVGDVVTLEGDQNISNLKFIRSGASDGTVMATLFYNI